MISVSGYDFVDFGCSAGGSIRFAKKYFGGKRELGIDADEDKIAKTRKLGYEAQLADLTQTNQFSGKVRFSILSHFLEHLPDATVASQVVRTAIAISRNFVFIRQPFFDADGFLAAMGVKCYWSDWSGHRNHMTTMQLYQSIRPSMKSPLLKAVEIYGNKPITSTESSAIIPLDAPVNQHEYDEGQHGPKASLSLPFKCYWETMAIIYMGDPPSKGYVQKLFPHAELLLGRSSASADAPEPPVVKRGPRPARPTPAPPRKEDDFLAALARRR